MDLWPDSGLDYEKIRQLADSPAGKQLISTIMKQNKALVEKPGESATAADMVLFKKNIAAFLCTDEAQKLLKQLGGSYGR